MLITLTLMFPLITSFMPLLPAAVESKQGGVRAKIVREGSHSGKDYDGKVVKRYARIVLWWKRGKMGWKRRRRRRRRRGGTSSVLQRLSQQYPNFFIVPTTFLCGHSAHHIFLTTLLYSHKLPAFPLLWSVNVIFMELKRFCQMSKLFGCVKLEQATIRIQYAHRI